VQLPRLGSIDVAELLATIRTRLVRLLARRAVIETPQELSLLPADPPDADLVLAQLASAAVSGIAPAGPERRQRAPIQLVHAQSATLTGPLCATDTGFSLHAATVARRDDPRGQEALLRYVLRLPLAEQRLELLDNGLCRLSLKRAFSDGTVAIELDPLSLLCRLAASVPTPGFNTVRYGGVLAPAAGFRPQLIPTPPVPTADHSESDTGAEHGCNHDAHGDNKRRSRWRPWAELLKRSFDIDLRCPRCNATMKLKAFVTSPKSLHRL
jgi:Putative transposase